MVDSGWSYNPLPEADDYVSCFYCGLSLDGWEPKDDPWYEKYPWLLDSGSLTHAGMSINDVHRNVTFSFSSKKPKHQKLLR